MNCRYFACPNCRVYIDAGYRWAYWQLEHNGLVRLGEGVQLSSVLACSDYWHPPEEEKSEWLCERILPAVDKFLRAHGEHGLVYIEEEHIYEEVSILANWSEVET